MITLYLGKKDCCACGTCMNICPRHAITMQPDEDGFLFPVIQNDLCVECGLCKKACAFQYVSIRKSEPIATYAAIHKNKDLLADSASGGMFVALASYVLEQKGIVFGCAYDRDMNPVHISIDNTNDLKKLQGSKYVQSNTGQIYIEVKKHLADDRLVLYSGTPCQIAALNTYLNQEFSKLITVDLICHGVPNSLHFQGYIMYLEKKLKGKVIDYNFRDKSRGWGMMGKVTYEKNGKIREKIIYPQLSNYFSHFLKGDNYRESCYECKYAGGIRQGDFTIGDFWGIENFHPTIKTEDGVSVVLVNSPKGKEILQYISDRLYLTESTYNNAKNSNSQLCRPALKRANRDAVLRIWREGGNSALEKNLSRQLVIIWLKILMPSSLKKLIKKIMVTN